MIVNKNRIIKTQEAQDILKRHVSKKALLTALIRRERNELDL